MNVEKRLLGDDLPKANPWEEDRLGFAPVARRIAQVIFKTKVPNGYVIGLHGQWGSGKSTVVNFTLAFLNKYNQENDADAVIHIDFRPWIVSGHQHLIVAFFKILAEKLGPKERWHRRLWGSLLKRVHGSTDKLLDATATMAMTLDPSGGVASGFASNVAKKSINSSIGKFLEDPSIQKAYEDLRSQLRACGKRFVVTIDDVDRLEAPEVRSIMRLVKSVGQLPNVLYLISYDRKIVAHFLDRDLDSSWPRFTEKIVQHEIELPKPSKQALLEILDEEIGYIIGSVPNSARWSYIVRDGISRWIRSPRDVVRLANAVKFSWQALESEFDPADLVAMEGVRLFDPAAFYWVKDSRDFFFSDGAFAWANDEEKKAYVEFLNRRINDENRRQVLRVLAVLFPQSAKSLEGRDYSVAEHWAEVAKRRGIGSEAGYDTYFGMTPSDGTIPRKVVVDVIDKLSSIQEIESVLRSYVGRKSQRGDELIGTILGELRLHFRTKNPAKPRQVLLDALFRVGEDVIALVEERKVFSLSPRNEISFLVRSMLEQWQPDEAGKHLIAAYANASSAAFMAEVYVDRGRELGVFESLSHESPAISRVDFDELGRILLPRIAAAAEDGSLTNAPYYFNVLRAWTCLADPIDAQTWISSNIFESRTFFVKLSQGLVSYSVGEDSKEYSMRDRPDARVYNLQVIRNAGMKHLNNADLNEDERNLIGVVVDASARFLGVAQNDDPSE